MRRRALPTVALRALAALALIAGLARAHVPHDPILDVAVSPELSIVAATPFAGSCTPTAASANCSLGTIAPQAEVFVLIDTVAQIANDATVSATVTSGSVDSDTSDNQGLIVSTIRPAADPDMDGDGVTVAQGDCNDADPDVYPGAGEFCNGLDDDCNGTTDDGGTATATTATTDDGATTATTATTAPSTATTATTATTGT